MANLSVIIVNYNVKAFLKNCISSVKKAAINIDTEIIVVDNASKDGSVELIKSEFPDIKLIDLDENLGFSKANNIGFRESTGKYICILNPDTLVQEDTFQKCLKFLEEKNDSALVGCKILNPNGTFQLACRRSFPTPWASFTKITGLSHLFPRSKMFSAYNLTYLSENKTYEVDAISGSFMFMPRIIYDTVNGFDESFFMYGEDLDFCYRVKKAGFKVYYYPETQIIHFKGESTKRSNIDEIKVFYGAMHLFVKKHYSYSVLLGIFLQTAIFLRSVVSYIAKKWISIAASFIDLILFNVSLFASEIIYSRISGYEGFPEWSVGIVFTVPALIFIIISYFTSSYQNNNFPVSRILLSILLNFLLITSLTFFFKSFAFSRAIVLILFFILLFLLPAWRIFAKIVFRFPRSIIPSLFESRTVIVGVNDKALELYRKLQSSKTNYFDIIGFIDKSLERAGEKIDTLEIIGSTENLNKIISEKKIGKVIFASDFLSFEEILKIVARNKEPDIHFQIVDSNFNFIVGKKDVVELEEIPFIEIQYNLNKPGHRLIKRIFDIFISFMMILTIFPIYFIYYLISHKKNKLLYLPLVLTGKYSIVGFPPENEDAVENYGKPGLTGIVQINRNRNLSNEDIEKLNTYYARNQNIWLDIEIIIKTVQNYFRD